ncbi:MAG: response regulator transcription factor [Flavobacteriales bacterium]|nr:response regulator transcription factor [Flavobacteriales bacterium]MCX7768806.1 response regulator transcription factor [Flavobacteriales bacterium]MDW8410665.1 response regulator transcription factor [Flavobacteriales bacterium]
MTSPSAYHILVVDDEPDILELLEYHLQKEGYKVSKCSNGREAISLARQEKPHLIVLDVMMPDLDGIETCRELRSMKEMDDVLIAFLTARGEDYSHEAGLDAGADDYILKPIKPRVFLSRIKALLRRSRISAPTEESVLDFGDLLINKERYTITYNNKEIELPKKEFELLFLLASKPGKVFRRDEILRSVWGDDVVVGDRTIDVHVRKIREKLDDKFIRTIKGVGYKFEF